MNEQTKTDEPALRVLIVEDNHFDTLMAETVLRRLGIPVMIAHAERLTEAVAKAATCADVVLLDLHLPDAGRTDALAAINRFGKPVVVMTGDENPVRMFEAARAGAAAAISKFAAHTQLLPTVLFVCGRCVAEGGVADPERLADLIEGAYP